MVIHNFYCLMMMYAKLLAVFKVWKVATLVQMKLRN
jgi:hypothetical protein